MSIQSEIQAELETVLPRHNPPTEAQAFAYVELLISSKLQTYKGVYGFGEARSFPVEILASSVNPGDFAFVYAFKEHDGKVYQTHFLTRILLSDNGSYRFKRLNTWSDHNGVVPPVNVPVEPEVVPAAPMVVEVAPAVVEAVVMEAAPAVVEAVAEQPKRGKGRGRRNETETVAETREVESETPAVAPATVVEPSAEEVAAVQTLFDQAATDPEGSVTVTRAEEPTLAEVAAELVEGGKVLTNDEPERSE